MLRLCSSQEGGGRRRRHRWSRRREQSVCLLCLVPKAFLIFLADVKYQRTWLMIQIQASEPTVQQQGRRWWRRSSPDVTWRPGCIRSNRGERNWSGSARSCKSTASWNVFLSGFLHWHELSIAFGGRQVFVSGLLQTSNILGNNLEEFHVDEYLLGLLSIAARSNSGRSASSHAT